MPKSPVLILEETDAPRPRLTRFFVLAALLFGAFLLVHNAVPLYTDWLWFREVGYTTVFTTTIFAKLTLFALFGLAFFGLLYGSVFYARRLASNQGDRLLMERFGPQWGGVLQRGLGWIVLLVAGFTSLWAGRIATDQWANYLEFNRGVPFHATDPVFHNDIGFYVFRLPFLNFVYGFLLAALLLTLVATVAVHIADRAIESFAGLPEIRPAVRGQVLLLAGLLALVQAFGTFLGKFDLLFNENGGFVGAGYADLHYRLLAINAQFVLLLLTAALCFVAIAKFSLFRWAVGGAVGWGLAMVFLGGIVPSALQKIVVAPNEFSLEQEYIKANIAATRQGFGLTNVRNIDNFPADESLNAAGLRANADTLDNARLWDYDYLAKVYAQTDTVKTYYKFAQTNLDGSQSQNMDIDRYPIGGKMRQVMLGAREMDSAALPGAAQTWQNRRLSYTHGYGLAMSPVNKVTDGLPDYLIQGFPPQAKAGFGVRVSGVGGQATEAREKGKGKRGKTEEAESIQNAELPTPDTRHPTPASSTPETRNPSLQVTRPEIYFGQLTQDYVFTDTTQAEFDYPASDAANGAGGLKDHYTNYQGKGGIRIGDSELAKLAFGLRLGDANILLARNLKPETRVLIRRDIRERIQTVAPFVQQDRDPYLVITDDGKLVWIVDCYTLSDHYPYSTPRNIAVGPTSDIAPNYIRNSVKATVDAYDGAVNLYLADTADPIAATYARIFPGLLKPLAELPKSLTAHLRYPEDLFRLQRSVYATYHVEDPRVFYLKEDAWSIPTEPNPAASAPAAPGTASDSAPAAAQMEPYYIMMRLPEMGSGDSIQNPKSKIQNGEEFLLMSPMAPIKREDKNMLGWMCARCDPAHYGELRLYRFPQNASVNGPTQIISLVNSDKTISPQLSLLRQGGSKANFGNLLVIPLGNSLLYVAPLYIESTNANLPQLQKVVVALGSRVAMENTLELALARLFPGYGEGTGNGEPGAGGAEPVQNPKSKIQNLTVRALIERASAQYQDGQQKLRSGDFAGYGTASKALEATLNELRRASDAANPPKSGR